MFAVVVTPEKLADSSLTSSLYKSNWVGRPAGHWLSLALYFYRFFAAIVYSFEKGTALHIFSKKSTKKASKAAHEAVRKALHEVEGLFVAPCPPGRESLEHAFITTSRQPLFFITGDFKAIPRLLHNDKRLYQLRRTASPHRGCKLIASLSSSLNALPDTMSVAVAMPVECQKSGRYKASAIYKEYLFATQIR